MAMLGGPVETGPTVFVSEVDLGVEVFYQSLDVFFSDLVSKRRVDVTFCKISISISILIEQ